MIPTASFFLDTIILLVASLTFTDISNLKHPLAEQTRCFVWGSKLSDSAFADLEQHQGDIIEMLSYWSMFTQVSRASLQLSEAWGVLDRVQRAPALCLDRGVVARGVMLVSDLQQQGFLEFQMRITVADHCSQVCSAITPLSAYFLLDPINSNVGYREEQRRKRASLWTEVILGCGQAGSMR